MTFLVISYDRASRVSAIPEGRKRCVTPFSATVSNHCFLLEEPPNVFAFALLLSGLNLRFRKMSGVKIFTVVHAPITTYFRAP